MSDDLVDFLKACVDEDERVARNAGASTYGLINHRAHRPGWSDLAEVHPTRRLAEFEDKDEASFQHIARHDPARVLAEVAVKRRIIDLLAEQVAVTTTPVRAHTQEQWDRAEDAREVVRHLASVYAGRPGWRAEWAPDEEATT